MSARPQNDLDRLARALAMLLAAWWRARQEAEAPPRARPTVAANSTLPWGSTTNGIRARGTAVRSKP